MVLQLQNSVRCVTAVFEQQRAKGALQGTGVSEAVQVGGTSQHIKHWQQTAASFKQEPDEAERKAAGTDPGNASTFTSEGSFISIYSEESLL